MNNMELWDSVEKTDPSHTKEVNFGRKMTAIDPYQQVKNATRAFGPVGKGWGWSVERVEYLPTNEMAVLIRLWHGEKENTFDQWGQAALYIDKAEKKKDGDCFKKATTDGVTKCLSFLGFNADIFLGKYDDVKYVQELKEAFKEPNPNLDLIVEAIKNKDKKWVKENWDGVINKTWSQLSEQQLSILNKAMGFN
jgi:hypothetical protein